MGKAVGAMALAFTLGGAAMSMLSGLLGGLAEPATLALVGMALIGTGQLVGTGHRLASKPSEA